LDAIDKAKQSHQLSTDITTRRTGPIVAVLASATTEQNAKAFLDQVNYDADITWNQDTGSSQRAVGHMMLGIIMLAGILIVIAIVASIAFGGFRVLMQRMFPNKVFDRPEQIELIALHLSEPAEKTDDPGVKLTN
jgi:predicted small integral membrane protein